MKNVTIYTREFCGYCARAKDLLTRKGVRFVEIDIVKNPDKRAEMTARSGGGITVPQIFIADQPVGGCDDLYALEAEGRLDRLLS